jgi:hypothetical protein
VTVRWVELADGVLVRRYAELDLSVGLVIGDSRCSGRGHPQRSWSGG